MNKLWPGIKVRIRGDRFKGLSKNKITEIILKVRL